MFKYMSHNMLYVLNEIYRNEYNRRLTIDFFHKSTLNALLNRGLIRIRNKKCYTTNFGWSVAEVMEMIRQ